MKIELIEMCAIEQMDEETIKIKNKKKAEGYQNHTGYIQRYLGEDLRCEIERNPYQNGSNFEDDIRKWFVNKLGFHIGEDKFYFSSAGNYLIAQHLLKENVPYDSTINKIHMAEGKKIKKKNQAVTEFVAESERVYPTIQFPASTFNDNGTFSVRIEAKYQDSSGSIYKKNDGIIREMMEGSPEKNFIFLMSGLFFKEDHYKVARYHANKMNSSLFGKKMVVMNEKDFVEWSLSAYIRGQQ